VTNDSPLKKALDEFLKRICEMAEGNTDKSINVFKIWDDNFPIRSLSRDTTLPIVLRSLKASNFISDGKNKDEVKVTLGGIYYVIDNLNVTPENIGALPRTDVKRFGSLFLQSVYELTRADPTRTVGVSDVQKRIKSISGTTPTPFIQIAEYLSSKGLIEIVKSNSMIRFRVPSQEIKKYYPPPPPPSPQSGSYSYTSFSSDSFST
jgi:hypothetical protein